MPFYRKKTVITRRNNALVHRFNAAVASARARLQIKLSKKKERSIEPLFSNTDLTVLRLPRDCVSATDVLSGVFPLTDKCSELDNKMGCLFSDSSLCSLHIQDSVVDGTFPLTGRAVESPEKMLFEDIKQPFRIATPCDSGYSGVFPLTDWAETPSQFKLFSDVSSISNESSSSKLFSNLSQTSIFTGYSLTESEIYKWLIDDLSNKIATLDVHKPTHSYSSVVSGVFPLTDHLQVESTWDLTGFFDEPARCPSFELSVRDMRTDESDHLSGVFPLSDAISASSMESGHVSDVSPFLNVSSLDVTSDHLSGIFPLTDRVTSEDRFLQQIRKTTLLLQRIKERLDKMVVPVCIKKESTTSIDSGYMADFDESSITSIYTEKSWCSSDLDTGYDTEDSFVSEDEEFKKSGQTLSDIFNDLFGHDYAVKRSGAGMDPELQKFNGYFDDEDIDQFFSVKHSVSAAIVDSLELISPRGFGKRRAPIVHFMNTISEIPSDASVPSFKDDETPQDVSMETSIVLSDNWFRHAMENRRASIAESISSLSSMSWFDHPNIGLSLPAMGTQYSPFIQRSFSDPHFYFDMPKFSLQSPIESTPMAVVPYKGTVTASREEVDAVKLLVQAERARWMLLALQCWTKISDCDHILVTLSKADSDC